MTPSTLYIACSSPHRTVGSELAQACLHVCDNASLLVRATFIRSALSCKRTANHYFFLRERWRAAQLEVEPGAARLRSGAEAPRKVKTCTAARPASRDSHAGRPCAALP